MKRKRGQLLRKQERGLSYVICLINFVNVMSPLQVNDVSVTGFHFKLIRFVVAMETWSVSVHCPGWLSHVSQQVTMCHWQYFSLV